MINKATRNKVIIWGSNGCGPCLKVKQMCQQWNFEYEWNNIDDPEVNEKCMEKYPAILSVPTMQRFFTLDIYLNLLCAYIYFHFRSF